MDLIQHTRCLPLQCCTDACICHEVALAHRQDAHFCCMLSRIACGGLALVHEVMVVCQMLQRHSVGDLVSAGMGDHFVAGKPVNHISMLPGMQLNSAGWEMSTSQSIQSI